jgi:hypothetical protein
MIATSDTTLLEKARQQTLTQVSFLTIPSFDQSE